MINMQYGTGSTRQLIDTCCERRTRPLEGARRHLCNGTKDNRQTRWNLRGLVLGRRHEIWWWI